MYVKYRKIKNLKKEIDAIIEEYNDYAYKLKLFTTAGSAAVDNTQQNNTQQSNIQRSNAAGVDSIYQKMNKTTNRLNKKIEKYEREIDSIKDDTLRLIVRMRCNGNSYEKIGDFMGYSKRQVIRILKRG